MLPGDVETSKQNRFLIVYFKNTNLKNKQTSEIKIKPLLQKANKSEVKYKSFRKKKTTETLFFLE